MVLLKVLFQIRNDYLSSIAGDSIILLNLRKSLIQSGIRVDVHTDTRINLSTYDIIHIFNTIKVYESSKFMENAKKHGKKVVLTPIYWELTDYYKKLNLFSKIDEWKRNDNKRKYLFDNCDIFLPHCKADEKIIINKFGNFDKSRIVPYGAQETFLYGEKNMIKRKYGLTDYILCVGRISEQKNQINLIKALLNEHIPLVLVGQINEMSYYKKCLEIGNKQLILLDKLEPGELEALYKGSKVHVLPSWVEYPGLVNFEAGLSGCSVVTTEVGSTKDVFLNYVRYCNPNDTLSIYHQTMEAFESKHNTELQDYILKNYTWTNAAEKIKEIYLSLV